MKYRRPRERGGTDRAHIHQNIYYIPRRRSKTPCDSVRARVLCLSPLLSVTLLRMHLLPLTFSSLFSSSPTRKIASCYGVLSVKAPYLRGIGKIAAFRETGAGRRGTREKVRMEQGWTAARSDRETAENSLRPFENTPRFIVNSFSFFARLSFSPPSFFLLVAPWTISRRVLSSSIQRESVLIVAVSFIRIGCQLSVNPRAARFNGSRATAESEAE